MKILAIVGSLRKGSYNRQLALYAQSILKDKVDFEILDYHDVPLFNQDYEFPAPESIKRVREKVREADGLWFFTPEYNHFFSGVLKNLLDWLSRVEEGQEQSILWDKPAAISGITEGMSGTRLSQDNLVTLLSCLNLKIMNVPRLTIANAGSQMDEKGNIKLDSSYKYLEDQCKYFIDFISNID